MAVSTNAQRMRYDTVPGYIVTPKHDTLAGSFQLTIVGQNYSSDDWYKKVYFLDSAGLRTKFESTGILGYGFALDSLRRYTFRSLEIVVPNKAGMFKSAGIKFVLVEVDGPISLYRFYHEEVGIGTYGWYYERYLQKEKGNLVLLKRNNVTQKYKLGETTVWFNDFPEVADYLEKELDGLGLKKLVFAYNTWRTSQSKTFFK
jgi:hypothetical protein